MATKKTAKTKTAKKTTKKATAKAPAKKAAAKKTTAKKTTVKKTATKKTAAKKATAKAPAKKTAAKKTTAKKTATKKTAAKKTAKKATVKKATPKKAAAKKTATKKTAAKTTAAKKTATKKTTRSTRKKKNAVKEAVEKLKRKNPGRVGQAPRKTTLAASIPVPTQIVERDESAAEVEAVKNSEEATEAKQDFKVKDKVVYPAHGVGSIVALEKQQVAGIAIELFVIDFDQEKMKLRVPTGKAKAAGMRPLSDEKTIKNSIELLKGRARVKRTMWSRRAQEYDAKINSGEMKLVAEVVRDLFRAEDQPEQSYSERQLFEAALDRLAREVAAARGVDLGKAIDEIEGVLKKKAAAAAAATAA